MTTTTPDTGRITLTLTAHTIKALRLLALLKGESQNDVAEALLIAGGLHSAVDSEWSAGKSEPTKPTATAPAPVQVPAAPKPEPTSIPVMATAPVHQVPTAPPKPAPARIAMMPDVLPPIPTDGDIPW